MCCILNAELKDSEPTDYPEDTTQNPNPKDFQEIMLNDVWEKAIGVSIMELPTDFYVNVCFISKNNYRVFTFIWHTLSPNFTSNQ